MCGHDSRGQVGSAGRLSRETSPVKVQSLLGHRPQSNGKQLLPGLPDPGQQGRQLLRTHSAQCPETLKPGHLAGREWRGELTEGLVGAAGGGLGEDPLPLLARSLFPSASPSVPVEDPDFLNRTQRTPTEGPPKGFHNYGPVSLISPVRSGVDSKELLGVQLLALPPATWAGWFTCANLRFLACSRTSDSTASRTGSRRANGWRRGPDKCEPEAGTAAAGRLTQGHQLTQG